MKNRIHANYDEEGQGLIEYGLIIAFVAVLLVGGLILFRGGIAYMFEDAGTMIAGLHP